MKIKKWRLFVIAAITSIFVIIIGLLVSRVLFPSQQSTSSNPTTSTSVVPGKQNPDTSTNQNPNLSKPSRADGKPKLGHFPYALANPTNLMIVASYAKGKYERFESMDIDAAKALMKMIYAARDRGIWIIPVSGFRTIEYQTKLFQEQIKRLGSDKEAAKLSAPPGYSEHHTGFAVDLANGKNPKQDVKYEFDQSDAFRWLNIHAKEYGFELSFPKGNPQGVSYEPWHWRYIGSPRAETIFSHDSN